MTDQPPYSKFREIDRTWKELGRVRIPINGLDRETIKGMGAMLTHLKKTGNVDQWRGLATGQTKPLEVYRRYLRNELDDVILVEKVQSGKRVMLEWVETLPESRRKSYKQYVNDLFQLEPDATVSELGEVLENLKVHYRSKGARTSMLKCKAVAGSYVKNTPSLGRNSALYRKIQNVQIDFASTHVHTGKAREVWDVVDAVKKMKQPQGAMFWSMCLLGTNPKEYLRDGFSIEEDSHGRYVRVAGKKNELRTRVAPLIFDDLVQPSRAVKWFRIELHKVRPDWMLKDARASYSHWMNMANIPKIRRQLYMGQEAGDVHSVYNIHELRHYLDSDAEVMAKYITSNMKKPEPKKEQRIVPKSNLFDSPPSDDTT